MSAAPPVPTAPNTARAATKARTAFMLQLNGLLDMLVDLLEGNDEVLRAEVAVRDFSTLYPTRIIEDWGRQVVPICGPQLLAKDLDYFMALDVPGTVRRLQDDGVLDAALDTSGLDKIVEASIRAPIRALAPADQTRCMDVLAVLTSLAMAYHAATTVPDAAVVAAAPVVAAPAVAAKRKAAEDAKDAEVVVDAKKRKEE